jgi:ribonuclease P/MRP protein subunit POP1
MRKRGKDKHLSRTESLLKRQRQLYIFLAYLLVIDFIIGDKTWLETHIWHAKRMHMKVLWGYSLVCRSYNTRNVESE